MPIDKLYGGTLALTAKALDLRAEKQGLIQTNIANMETPGYKTQDFSFEKVMASLMTGKGHLDKTHKKHMELDPMALERSLSVRSEDRPVDLDEEMLKLSESQLMYQIGTQIIAKKFDALRYVIDEGGK
ncbi:MAG: flagellar basal body rod protein FlgB [Proteobacteria bacterium]|nr:flagellar basal body rod protein FlgB [Pseudomonadota bacterium]MBU1710542.1 flagellar basal body rod protein FlgB [Pseudomonadota bacterium]